MADIFQNAAFFVRFVREFTQMADPTQLMRTLKASLDRNDRAGVTESCRALIMARAPLGAQWRAIASVLLHNGEMRLARAAADRLVVDAGNSPLARFEQAATYARSGQPAEAWQIMSTLPSNVPDPLGNAYIRGTTATTLGMFDEARAELRRATTLAPTSGQSWLALAMVGTIADSDADALLAARPIMANAPPAERAPYLYALGKLHDQRGRYDDAFACFSEGAAVVRTLRPFDREGDRRSALAAQDGWTAEAIETLPRREAQGHRAIFVTGLPRSGTTLVEQILFAHSRVGGGDEFGFLGQVAEALGGNDIATVRRAGASGLAAGAALYDHLLDERYPGSDLVVDKTLQTSRYLGIIAALYPDAPVVWLRRDPLDCAWSAFRTWFHSGLAWTFDLAEIGRHMAVEDRLFEHWTRVRPGQVLAVDYAEMVQDPNAVIPRIVAHCGLELEPQQMRAHESRRAVTTASVAQVRQPIHANAIGSAEPYRAYLQPFIDAYAQGGKSKAQNS